MTSTTLTQAQACLEALERISSVKSAGIAKLAAENASMRLDAQIALPAAQRLVDTLSKQGGVKNHWSDCNTNGYDDGENIKYAPESECNCEGYYAGDDLNRKAGKLPDARQGVLPTSPAPTQQPIAIAEQWEGLRNIREALESQKELSILRVAFRAAEFGAGPRIMERIHELEHKQHDALALIDRMIGGE